jgi:exonuclease III
LSARFRRRYTPCGGRQDVAVKILCLNVRSGGGQRWQSILDFADARGTDVIVFTEWRCGVEGGSAENWASSRGMRWARANEGATRNGVFVAAKENFDSTSVPPGPESAGTLLRVQFDVWTMLACYFPQGRAKSRYFDACRDVAEAVSAKPFLIVGDLNTGNQVADRTPTGERYACAERFDWLSEAGGLVDLWRRTNGAAAREWRWLTSKNGFRLDHAFGNGPLVKRFDPSCQYDDAPRKIGFSDHSAVLVAFTKEA